MSEDAFAENFGAEFDEFGPKKKLSGKRLVLFVILPLLLAGGGVIAFGGLVGPGHGDGHAGPTEQSAPPPKTTFYELPEILVNLNTTSRRPSFLKIMVSLELADEGDVPHLNKLKPRIIDNFQVYLRELRVDDLRGSAGIYRLREELLARVNVAVHPAQVKNVLFKEILIQ